MKINAIQNQTSINVIARLQRRRFFIVSLDCPTNTPRGFHVETTWKRPFPRRFNMESTWCVCRVELLLARSRLSQLAMACSQSFHCLQATKSQNILTCNFTINQLLKRSVRVFIHKAGQLF